MNLITCDHAYALFPVDTFEKRCTLVTGTCNQPDTLLKYMERGFAIHRGACHAADHMGVYRFTGDKWTWTIPLDTDGIYKRLPITPTSDTLPWDPSVPNRWTMVDNNGPKFKYELKAYPITRYEYLVAHEEHGSMMDELFDELSWFEGSLAQDTIQLGSPVTITWWVQLCFKP